MRAVRYRWTGTAWEPFPAFLSHCQEQFVEGESRWLDEHHDRSPASHNHYFACLHEIWSQLSDELRLQFPRPQNLRKWCLIEAGWMTEMEGFTMVNPTAALRLAHDLSRAYPDDRIFVEPRDPRVVRWQMAKSQSLKAMGKKSFQKSKDDVLAKAAELIGVSVEELQRNAGRAT